MKCTKRRTDGNPCTGNAINGRDACPAHVGEKLTAAKAKGAVVVELRRWGLTGHDELADPGTTLLRLLTQSAARAEHYAQLLQQAYDAAERLQAAEEEARFELHDGYASVDSRADRDRAQQDLARIFTTGGVAALIGGTYSATTTGHVYESGEAIRGLVRLEAEERDRCANFAVKGIAAGLAERQVRLAERQGALVADVMRLVLADLGLDVADPRVMQVVSTRIEALAGATA